MRARSVAKLEWVAKVRWEPRRPRPLARTRLAGGLVLLAMTSLLLAYRRGGLWTALLALATARDFYGASRVPRAVAASRHAPDCFFELPL